MGRTKVETVETRKVIVEAVKKPNGVWLVDNKYLVPDGLFNMIFMSSDSEEAKEAMDREQSEMTMLRCAERAKEGFAHVNKHYQDKDEDEFIAVPKSLILMGEVFAEGVITHYNDNYIVPKNDNGHI
jgi:hypothetical protein